MEEYPEISENARSGVSASMGRRGWLIDFILVLALAALALGYGYRQRLKVRHLAAQGLAVKATINDLERQLNDMSDKLNEVASARQGATVASVQNTREKTAKTAAVDRRYQQLQTRLTEQQRQLKETQDLVARNRRQLEWSLNSTRDELNGSIARTHEELVVLAKRGERSYFEFDLAKSKEFQRFGPLPLSLRKTDTKHNSFDMAMIVDDNTLMKKKANLYESIWIHTENQSQPVQIVVNRITKELVHGYVSSPKYKPSELATGARLLSTPWPNREIRQLNPQRLNNWSDRRTNHRSCRKFNHFEDSESGRERIFYASENIAADGTVRFFASFGASTG